MSGKPVFNETELLKIKEIVRQALKEADKRYYTKDQILITIISVLMSITSILIGYPQIIPNLIEKKGQPCLKTHNPEISFYIGPNPKT